MKSWKKYPKQSKQSYSVALGFGFLLESSIIIATLLLVNHWLPLVGLFFRALSLTLALWLLSSAKEPAFKLCWYWLLLPFSLVGGVFFLRMGGLGLSGSSKKQLHSLETQRQRILSATVSAPVNDCNPANQEKPHIFHYLEKEAHFPAFSHTRTQYYPSGESMFESMKEYIQKAETYIFLEYFILADGLLWRELLTLFQEKRQQGVEIRILYDEVGCLFTLPHEFHQTMKEWGIQTKPVHPLSFQSLGKNNRRDHRKMMLIDGIYGFTGGINLADEYINKKHPFGHWKDCGILLEGVAVWSMTVQFLSMWKYASCAQENLLEFLPKKPPIFQETGLVLPYTDILVEEDSVALRVLLSLIAKAKKTVFLTSPYLMLDTALETLLCVVAKNGVDVRIITPSIPDKKAVFQVTRGQYPSLLEAGVQIFEYSKGFIHSKTLVIDEEFAIVGTINLDYRSLFLQFEQGVLLWRCDTIDDIATDFLATQEMSTPYTTESEPYFPLKKMVRSVLSVFSPLM